MDNITLYKLILEGIFNLQNHVWVKPRRNILWPGKIPCWGMYTGEHMGGKKFDHRIEYNPQATEKQIFATLAHEYVHAWQMEMGLELEHEEQEAFRDWEQYFKTHYGVNLQEI